MRNYSDFGDFLGNYFGDSIGAFLAFGLVIAILAAIIKLFDIIGIAGAKIMRNDPNSGKGERIRYRIGFTLVLLFFIFALFIAPNIN